MSRSPENNGEKKEKIMDIFRPYYKWQLVYYFSQKYPDYPVWKWKKMKLINLKGKYYKERLGKREEVRK